MTTPRTLSLPRQALQAEIVPASVNRAARTVDVVWSTGARVRFWDYEVGTYDLTLALKPENVRLDFARQGAPVLDAHANWSVQGVLGVVDSIDVDGKQGTATLRFSESPEGEAAWRKIAEGVVRFVSVGTQLHALEDVSDDEDKIPHYLAVDHEPREISLAPIPRDRGAVIQSEEDGAERFPVRLITQSAHAAPNGGNMADPTPKKTTPKAPDAATLAERERGAAIRHVVRQAQLSESFADELVEQGATIERARELVLDRLAEQGDRVIARPTVSVGTEEYDRRLELHELFGEALAARDHGPTPRREAEAFVGWSIGRMARESLRHRGMRVPSSDALVITQAITTSDIPAIVSNMMNKRLAEAHKQPPAGVLSRSREGTSRTFHPVQKIQAGEAPKLLRVLEGGEITRGPIGEMQESYSIATYARIVWISRQALVNDDLGALIQTTDRLARAGRELEATHMASKVSENPVLNDGEQVFSAAHGNLAPSGAPPSIETLTAARKAMRRQKGIDGETLVEIVPTHLVVPAALETVGEQVLASIAAAEVANANPFTNRLQLVVDPRLDDASEAAWSLCADGSEGLEHAYLEGARGPQVFTREGFDVEGVEFKVRSDFGGGWVDFRSWYCNPGE